MVYLNEFSLNKKCCTEMRIIMSLQLILGGSGAGKSTYLYSSIIEESINNPDTDYIIIVPEQYTMATQKRVVELHPRKGILNIRCHKL